MSERRRWFRLVLDDQGKVVHCAVVGEEGPVELGVHFILAASAKEAARLATNAHCARLLAARRARYEAEGRCKCGRERDRPNPEGGLFKTCSGCDARHKVHEARKRAKDRGEAVPPLDRRTVLLERKDQERATVRFETLTEVQRAFLKLGPRRFERWLGEQLEKIAGRKAS